MMGRMTRKQAAEVAEQLHIDEDDLLNLPSDDIAAKADILTPGPNERAPLADLAPNSADSKSDDVEHELKKSTRGRKGGKKGGTKSNKKILGASTTSEGHLSNELDAGKVLPDEMDSAPSPASEKAAEDLMKDIPGCKYQYYQVAAPYSDTR